MTEAGVVHGGHFAAFASIASSIRIGVCLPRARVMWQVVVALLIVALKLLAHLVL